MRCPSYLNKVLSKSVEPNTPGLTTSWTQWYSYMISRWIIIIDNSWAIGMCKKFVLGKACHFSKQARQWQAGQTCAFWLMHCWRTVILLFKNNRILWMFPSIFHVSKVLNYDMFSVSIWALVTLEHLCARGYSITMTITRHYMCVLISMCMVCVKFTSNTTIHYDLSLASWVEEKGDWAPEDPLNLLLLWLKRFCIFLSLTSKLLNNRTECYK